MRRRIESWLQGVWYGNSAFRWLLMPFSWLYRAVTAGRRTLYSLGICKTLRLPVPVIVVGNVTAGGTGKTPLAMWLAERLADMSYAPAIVSRGYRGKVGSRPLRVGADSDPAVVGDEAVLMARRCDFPVIVHPDRVAAARLAVELGSNIIVSDDGLQHYRLGRDFEIAVVDGDRLFGNRQVLPAGPLREPLSRLDAIDQVFVQRNGNSDTELHLRRSDLPPIDFRQLVSAICRLDDSDIRSSAEFSGVEVHALAGIGNPQRFFRLLESQGIRVIPHALADHADIGERDLDFGDGREILMTEKDAVKCRYMRKRNCWYVPVDVLIDDADADRLLNRIRHKTKLQDRGLTTRD